MAPCIARAIPLTCCLLAYMHFPAFGEPNTAERRAVFDTCIASCTPIQLERDVSGFSKTDGYLFEAFCACQCARITSRLSPSQFHELRGFLSAGKPLIQLPWYVEMSHKSQKACTSAISEN